MGGFYRKIDKILLTDLENGSIIYPVLAEVAELADAHGSGPCGSNTLWVRLPSSAVYGNP